MGILFIVAVLFAIPTYGVSLAVWFGVALMRAKGQVHQSTERENRRVFVEPLFTGQFAEFFHALDMPLVPGGSVDHADAHECGRHIMNYIAHNPEEGVVFMRGLNKWRTKGQYSPCHPVIAARDERTLNCKGEIHLVAYRAVEAVMVNNPGLSCFRSIDRQGLTARRLSLELQRA